jgi:hypothetical protein
MVKREGGWTGCCAESERATTRRACKRTAAQLMQYDVPPVLSRYVPCALARRCGGEWLREKGAKLAAARRAKGRPRAGHAKRTAAHGTQEAGKLAYDPAGQEDAGTHDDAPNALYVPCATARRSGGEWLRGKGAGQAAARGAKGRPRAGDANAPPRKTGTRRRRCFQCLGCTCPAQWRGGAGENGKGGRGLN